MPKNLMDRLANAKLYIDTLHNNGYNRVRR